jgi:hypothetical protein
MSPHKAKFGTKTLASLPIVSIHHIDKTFVDFYVVLFGPSSCVAVQYAVYLFRYGVNG